MTTLVTGALGCIGAWTVKHLVEQDQPVVSFDLAAKGHRIDALMTTEEQTKVTFVVGDLRDFDTVLNTVKEYGITKPRSCGS